MNDVAQKMVRRHPHVFGTVEADTSEQVLQNWEEIKKKEKEGKTWTSSPLRDIPIELPALTRATKVLKKADKLYEYDGSRNEDLCKIEEAVQKLKEIPEEAYSEEAEAQVGKILLAVCDLSRRFKLSPEQILADCTDEIIETYEPGQ